MNKIETWLNTKTDIGILALRIFIGIRVAIGTFDNIISWERMIEFSKFLEATKFPAPIFCAVTSVYAQFICALLILIGYKTRFAAFILVLNFVVAIVMVHRKDSIEMMTPALAILFICIALLLIGSGKYAIEKMKPINQTNKNNDK